MQSFLSCAPHLGGHCEDKWASRIRDHNSFVQRAHFEWGPEGVPSRVSRVLALSDPHGDARLLLLSLLAVEVVAYVEGKLVWTGGTALVVICGDLIDDCRINCAHEAGPDAPTRRMELGADGANEWEVLALLSSLVANGARIVWVLGNHEHMRMMGQQERHYQRHVSRGYEDKFMPGAWREGGRMRRLFGPLRVAVSVGNALFLHADPVAPSVGNSSPRTYGTVREYVEAVNRLVDSGPEGVSDRKNSKLVWGRKAGHRYTEAVCEKITRHIKERTLVVRGHCVTGDADRPVGLSIASNPATSREHFVSTNEYKQTHHTAGITFGCLGFENGGVVSGIARVDCGASASMQLHGKHKLMSVLEIATLAGKDHCFALTERRFRVDAKTQTSVPSPVARHRSPRLRTARASRSPRDAQARDAPHGREAREIRPVYGDRRFYTPAGA